MPTPPAALGEQRCGRAHVGDPTPHQLRQCRVARPGRDTDVGVAQRLQHDQGRGRPHQQQLEHGLQRMLAEARRTAHHSPAAVSCCARTKVPIGRGGSCQMAGTRVGTERQQRRDAGQLLAQRGIDIAGRQSTLHDHRRPRSTARRRSRAPRRRRSCCTLRPGARRRGQGRGGRSAVSWSTSRARWLRAKQRRPGQASSSGTRRSSNGKIKTRPSVIGRGGRSRASRARTGSSSRSTAPRRSSMSIRPTTRSSCSSLAAVMSRSSAGMGVPALMPWRPAAARRGRGSPAPSARCASPRAADPAAPVEADIVAPAVAAASRSFGSSIGSAARICCSVSRCTGRSSRATASHMPQICPQPSSSHSGRVSVLRNLLPAPLLPAAQQGSTAPRSSRPPLAIPPHPSVCARPPENGGGIGSRAAGFAQPTIAGASG